MNKNVTCCINCRHFDVWGGSGLMDSPMKGTVSTTDSPTGRKTFSGNRTRDRPAASDSIQPCPKADVRRLCLLHVFVCVQQKTLNCQFLHSSLRIQSTTSFHKTMSTLSQLLSQLYLLIVLYTDQKIWYIYPGMGQSAGLRRREGRVHTLSASSELWLNRD